MILRFFFIYRPHISEQSLVFTHGGPRPNSGFIEDDSTRAPLEEVLMYLRMLSDDMTSLRTQLSNLKYDNHLLFKQVCIKMIPKFYLSNI